MVAVKKIRNIKNVKDCVILPITPGILLAAIICVGAALRLFYLTHFDLWYDEVYSIMRASNILRFLQHMQYTTEEPFYYILLKGWIFFWGDSAYAVRILSVIAGVVSIPLIFGIGRLLYGAKTGILSACILAFSPFHIWYSQQARAYGISVFFVLMAFYTLIRATASARQGWRIASFILVIISCYLNYFSLFLVVPMMVYAFSFSKETNLKKLLISVLLMVFIAPLIVIIMRQSALIRQIFWISLPDFDSVISLLGNFIVGYSVSGALTVAGAALVIALFTGWMIGAPRDKRYSLLLAVSIIPVFLIYFISQRIPVFVAKTCIIFSPFFFLVIANGLMKIGAFLRRSVIYILLALMIPSLINYYSGILPAPDSFHTGIAPPAVFHNAVSYIRSRLAPGDVIAHSNFHTLPPFLYYLEGTGVTQMYLVIPQEQEDRYWRKAFSLSVRGPWGPRERFDYKTFRLRDGGREYPGKRIWLVSSGWKIDGVLDHHAKSVRKRLKKRFTFINTTYIDGMFIDLYHAVKNGPIAIKEYD